MTREFISSKSVGGGEFKAPKKVDIDKYLSSRSQTKKNFQNLGFSLEDYEQSTLGFNDQLHRNPNATNFFLKVNTEKEEITQKITTLIRLKAPEYYRPKGKPEKSTIKEFLCYHVELYGVDFLNNSISCRIQHIGKSYEPQVRTKISVDSNGHQSAQYVFSQLRPKYFIPWSPSTVKKLIKDTGSDSNEIKYVGYIPHDSKNTSTQFRYVDYTLEEFLLPWDEFEAIARAPNTHWVKKEEAKVFVG